MFHIFTLVSLQAQQPSSSALVGCCTTRRPTPATGPRMWPAARSIVSISVGTLGSRALQNQDYPDDALQLRSAAHQQTVSVQRQNTHSLYSSSVQG